MTSSAILYNLFKESKFDLLEKKLQENMIEEIQKKANVNPGKKKAFNNLYKLCQKENLEKLHKCHMYNDFYCLANGHYILGTKENYGVEVNPPEAQLNLSKMFDIPESIEVKVNVKELKFYYEYLKANKLQFDVNPYILKVEENLYIAFRSDYLLDCLTFCDSDTLVVNTFRTKSILCKNPALIKSDSEIALLLPVNIQDDLYKYLKKQHNILKNYIL